MPRSIRILLSLTLISITCLAAAGTRLLWLSGTIVASAQSTAANLNASTAALKQALTGSHANGDDGILYTARFVLREAAQTSNVVRQTSMQERDGLSRLTGQSSALLTAGTVSVKKLGTALDSINGAATSLGTVAASLDTVVTSLNSSTLPDLDRSLVAVGAAAADVDTHMQTAVDAAARAVADLDGLISDPSWHNTLLHADQTTASVQHSAGEIDVAITNVLNPKKRGFWATIGVVILKELIPKPTFSLP